MLRNVIMVVFLFPLIFAACGDNGNGGTTDADMEISGEDIPADPDVDQDVSEDPAVEDVVEDEPEPDVPPPFGTCASFSYTLTEGLNSDFTSNGIVRGFHLELPDSLEPGSGPWPVIFVWHGSGGSADWSTEFIRSLVDDPDFSFIGVAPVSLPLEFPEGFEWDLLAYDPEDNDDVFLFDDILACLDEAYGVDPDHIHSIGFSAGAIMTSMISVARGDTLASIVTYSGAFFSDPEQAIDPRLVWPEYDLTNKFTALLAWGGESDTVTVPPFATFDFNQSALLSIDYLNGLGHDVIACNHDQGHTVPSDLSSAPAVEFLKDHPLGSHPTPYSSDGLPADFPDYCEIHPAE